MYAPYLTPEMEEHRAEVRKWAETELAPLRDKYEETNLDGVGKNPPLEVYKKLGEKRLLAEHIPEKYGGKGKSFLWEIITIEEISRICASFCSLVDYTPTLVCNPIFVFGTEEQKEKYLPPLVRGEKTGSFAVTEAEASSNVAAIETMAKREGEEYIINGNKKFITMGNIADILLVFAKTKPEAEARGITTFIVEANTKGISYPKQERKMGLRAIPVSDIKFENVKVSADSILGGPEQENKGIYIALNALDHGRCGIAAQAVGIIQAAIEQATRYASERVQFDKEIINFEAVQWMIADMATKLDAARLLTYRAAYLRDLAIKGEVDYRMVTVPAAVAKCFSTEAATWAAHRAIQIFGGRGYMMDPEYVPIKELPTPEKLYRDSRITEIYEGTNEIQRMVISSGITRLYGKKK